MAGRAGLGLAQGFMQGYDFMQRIDEREQRMGLRDQQNQRATESHQWRGEQVDRQREEWQRADDQRLVQSVYQGLQSGQLDPDLAEEYGKRFDVDWGNYLDPEFGNSLQVLEKTAAGEGYTLRDPEFKQAFGRVFSREIGKGNGERYQGEDGEYEIAGKSVRGVYPGPDGQSLMVDLDILERGPSGERRRNAPVTTNRSANDDEVKQIPLEAALQKLKGHQLMYNAVQNDPQLQSLIKQHAARVGAQLPQAQTSDAYRQTQELQALGLDPEQARNQAYGIKPEGDEANWRRLNNGDLYNQRTGEVLVGVGSQGSSSGQAPADVKTAEWMMQVGLAESPDQAWSLLNESKSDPARFVATYVDQEMKAQENAGLYPGDENYRSTDDMRQSALEALRAIRSQTRGLGGQPQQGDTGQPAGLELNRSSVQVLPEDGSAVPAPDGGMQGRVNRDGQAAGLQQQQPAAPRQPAPAAAVEHLRNNPQLADQFRAKYGYLPEGF